MQSLGPKKVAFLWKTFKAGTVEQVEKLAREGKLRDLAGFGEKSEENILKAIEVYKKSAGRFHIDVAAEEADKLVSLHPRIRQTDRSRHARRLAAARQGNRRRPRPAGYDLVAESTLRKPSNRSRNTSSHFPEIDQKLAHGENKVSFLLKSGMQVDVRILEKESLRRRAALFHGIEGAQRRACAAARTRWATR